MATVTDVVWAFVFPESGLGPSISIFVYFSLVALLTHPLIYLAKLVFLCVCFQIKNLLAYILLQTNEFVMAVLHLCAL